MGLKGADEFMPKSVKRRSANNPERRIADADQLDLDFLNWLIDNAEYTGSAHHKRISADYGLDPPTAPRPDKSLCDGKDVVLIKEAIGLFRNGIAQGMVSAPGDGDGDWRRFPKYVWSVSADRRVFEAVHSKRTNNYHGYELTEDDDVMRREVIYRWEESNCLIT